MRKQYHFFPGAHGLDAWDVDRLIELSSDLEPFELAVADVPELDTAYWFGAEGGPMTVRVVAEHARLIAEVDPDHPVILGADGRVMDGMHRIARALLEGRSHVAAVRFEVDPPPDYRDCSPGELPGLAPA